MGVRIYRKVEKGESLSNPGQPTIALGATGAPVRRLQRALLRTLDLGLTVDAYLDRRSR